MQDSVQLQTCYHPFMDQRIDQPFDIPQESIQIQQILIKAVTRAGIDLDGYPLPADTEE